MAEFQGTITRRLESVLLKLGEEFGTVCTKYDVEVKLNELNRARGKSDYFTKLGNLMDLLDSLNIEYEERDDFDYFAKIVDNLDLPDFMDIEDKMIYNLYKIYDEYPVPEEYMRRIVNRLSNPEDNWQEDSLRLRILKQFIKYGNYLYDAGCGGKGYIKKYVKAKLGGKIPSKNEEETILNNVDDEIFSVLDGANKDQREFSGTYGLLKVCDDLASGQFRMGGATRKNLYLFAIVYNMTFYTGSSSQIIDYKSDIEKNLFHDYYVNNLMRFLTDAYKDNKSSFEKEPSGQGINYRSFAEMIYLYFISKSSEEYTPAEKIRLSADMINNIKVKGYKETEKYDDAVTKFLKEVFLDEVLSKSEEEFEEYLLSNYDCNTYVVLNGGKSGTKVNEMQIALEQNTAFGEFTKTIEALKDEVELEDISYGLWFADFEKDFDTLNETYPDMDKAKFDEFVNLISEMDKAAKIESRIEEVTSSKEVTRTALLVALYHLYNVTCENNDDVRLQTFGEVFQAFSLYANEILAKASYQPISGKNIFDVLIVFSIYAYQIN